MAVGRNKIRDVVPVPKPPGSYDAIVTTWGGGFSIPNPACYVVTRVSPSLDEKL
jgi:hypothetical protein